MPTGWSPLPFAMRLASIKRKEREETQRIMVRDIHRFRELPPPLPTPPPSTLVIVEKTKGRRKKLLTLPPPIKPSQKLTGGLAAYTQVLWPPDRRRKNQRKRHERHERHERQKKTLQSINKMTDEEIQNLTKRNRTSFLWLPFFRKSSGGFTEEGRNTVAARQLYDRYVAQHSFAFNNCGCYYIESQQIPNRRFYGTALDLDQARHRLIDLMRQGRSVPRLQQIYDQTLNERDIEFHIVRRISPFHRKVGPTLSVRVSVSFDEYRKRLYDELKGLVLQYSVGRVHKSKIFPIVWKEWTDYVTEENRGRFAAALQIQGQWRKRMGSFALHLKRVARKHQQETTAAANKIQSMWRIRQGGLALHLKRQLKRAMEQEDTAVRKLQHWWSMVNGSFAAKMKARAKIHLMKEEQEADAASRRLQHWWSMMNGSFAAKMKARAKLHLMKEEQEMERAALKIQVAWRRRQGNLGAHMKRQAQQYADEQEALELRCVIRLQVFYRQKHGKLASHMACSQRRQTEEGVKRTEQAAVYVQYRWRVSKGMLAQHLIRQARKRVKRRRKKRKTETFLYEHTETRASVWNLLLWDEQQDPVDVSNDWMKCWDDTYQAEYWYNRETEESTWIEPT